MQERVDITPHPRLLRVVGDIPFAPWQCIAELIDNALDAFTSCKNQEFIGSDKRIIVSWSGESVPAMERQLEVTDTGPGIDLTTIQNTARAGYTNRDAMNSLGHHSTPASSVAKAYYAFLERYPFWESLSKVTNDEIEKSIKELGLSRLKAEIFRNLCEAIKEHGGIVPATRSELEQIKGVGQYTASAVLTVVHDQHEPLVDVNVARVLGRFFGRHIPSDVRDDPDLHVLSRYIVNADNCLEINWAILDLGAFEKQVVPSLNLY